MISENLSSQRKVAQDMDDTINSLSQAKKTTGEVVVTYMLLQNSQESGFLKKKIHAVESFLIGDRSHQNITPWTYSLSYNKYGSLFPNRKYSKHIRGMKCFQLMALFETPNVGYPNSCHVLQQTGVRVPRIMWLVSATKNLNADSFIPPVRWLTWVRMR